MKKLLIAILIAFGLSSSAMALGHHGHHRHHGHFHRRHFRPIRPWRPLYPRRSFWDWYWLNPFYNPFI